MLQGRLWPLCCFPSSPAIAAPGTVALIEASCSRLFCERFRVKLVVEAGFEGVVRCSGGLGTGGKKRVEKWPLCFTPPPGGFLNRAEVGRALTRELFAPN